MNKVIYRDAKEEKREITTIKLSKRTKERLDKMKVYKRESYEEILESIFDILNVCRINPEKAKMKLILIDEQKKARD